MHVACITLYLFSMSLEEADMDCSMQGTDLEDQESRLSKASQMYVVGEIDVDEFEQIKSSCTPDLKKAMMSLSRRKIYRAIVKKVNPLRMLALLMSGC